MSRPIPEIRARLYVLAVELGCDELRVLANDTFREKAVRRARARHPKVRAKLRDAVKAFAADHEGWHFTDIANHFRINPGRVSEILNGKYDRLLV